MRKIKIKSGIFSTLKIVIMVAFCITAILPIALCFVYSISTSGEIVRYFSKLGDMGKPPFIGLKLVPDMMSVKQYYGILIEEQKFLRYFVNSSWYAVATVLGQVMIAPLAAYAFSKFKFRFRDTLFFVYIIIMMMPFQVVMIPNYIAIRNMGLYDTGWSLILPGIFMPFAVFLMRQYMLSVPDDMIEAARIDGAGAWRVYFRIVLPMVAPGLAAMIVLCFAEAWNLVEQPLLFIQDISKYPLSLAFRNPDIAPMRLMFAGSVLFMAPVIILFMIFQDDIISGIAKISFKD